MVASYCYIEILRHTPTYYLQEYNYLDKYMHIHVYEKPLSPYGFIHCEYFISNTLITPTENFP